MKNIPLKTLFILLLFISAQAIGQNNEKKYKPFKLKLGYSSNQIYNGRSDSIAAPYLTGSFKYLDSSGFYVKTSLSYLTSNYAQRIDLIGIGIGYQKLIKNQFLVSASFDKSFYNSNSFSVSSEILGNLGGSFYYLNDIVDIGANFGALFTTNKHDMSLGFDISHEFDFDNDHWSIEPTASLSLSTRNYSQIFNNNRQTKISNSGNQSRSTDTQTILTLGADKLTLLNYELSVPIYYYGKNMGLFVAPAFSIAQNPAVILTTNTARTNGSGSSQTVTTSINSVEKLKNYFYIETGIYFKF
jgi:hypothetical protein